MPPYPLGTCTGGIGSFVSTDFAWALNFENMSSRTFSWKSKSQCSSIQHMLALSRSLVIYSRFDLTFLTLIVDKIKFCVKSTLPLYFFLFTSVLGSRVLLFGALGIRPLGFVLS